MALLHHRQAQQKAGQCRACTVVGCGLGGEAIRKLVVSAVLKESPHRPDETPVIAPDFERVPVQLAMPDIPYLDHRVPVLHRRGGKGISESAVTLQREPRHAPGAFTAETHTLNAELSYVVVSEIVL